MAKMISAMAGPMLNFQQGIFPLNLAAGRGTNYNLRSGNQRMVSQPDADQRRPFGRTIPGVTQSREMKFAAKKNHPTMTAGIAQHTDEAGHVGGAGVQFFFFRYGLQSGRWCH